MIIRVRSRLKVCRGKIGRAFYRSTCYHAVLAAHPRAGFLARFTVARLQGSLLLPVSKYANSLTLAALGLDPNAVAQLSDALRRQLARFLLRWRSPECVLALLPEEDVSPRDGYDRCRALLAAGRLEEARDLARELVNLPHAGHWGHRAVGEVFLALEKPDRADERFRAGQDPVGRARAYLMLGQPERALQFLRQVAPDDPEAEQARRGILSQLPEQDASEVDARLRDLLAEELDDLHEALGIASGSTETPRDADALRAALKRVFGYDDFRAGQLEVILPLMEGRSVLGLMPTGAGKSLCFQVPAALLPGATVVISPLIALMKDQVDGLPPRLYRRATLINSALDPGEADRRLDAIASGEVSLIYAAPERLRHRAFVRALQRRGVSLFVIDEAHCVSLWGHDFRPDYFFISDVLRDLGRPTVLALTATATPEMQDDIGRQLQVPLQRVNLGTFRPNLSLSVRRLANDTEKRQALLELVRQERGPTIIYVDRRQLAEELAALLREGGIAAEAYHAGMDRDVRDRTQTRFMLGEVRVITATVAFGMGVDKADVRLVVHYNLPRSLEAYYQEAGRAGRDGLPGRCILLYTSYDRGNVTRRTARDRREGAEMMDLYHALERLLRGGMATLPAVDLETESGLDNTRLRVGISLLQRLGAVQRGYDLPGTVWIARRPLHRGQLEPSARFEQFAVRLGLQERAAATFAADRAAKAAEVALDALEPLLLDWQEAGWIRFRTGQRGMGLHLMHPRGLEKDLLDLLGQMEERDQERVELLNRYLSTAECRPAFVSRYFGRELAEPCGTCDNCRGTGASGADSRRTRASITLRAGDEPISDAESALFELLRAWRRERARGEGVPAYVIFHDRVLYEIARSQPRTLAALGDVPGVGRGKLDAYGKEVLDLVKKFEAGEAIYA